MTASIAGKAETAPRSDSANRKLGIAWILLALALAAHVTDEALTGFLPVYNATIIGLRQRMAWFPAPTFTFGVWLWGLIAVVVLLLCASPLFFRGVRWIRIPACLFAALMIVNAFGHTAGTIFGRTFVASVTFPRPMPGFYSSPLLLLTSVYFLLQIRRTAEH